MSRARERADFLIEMEDIDFEQRALAGMPTAPTLSELKYEAARRENKALADNYWFNVFMPRLRGWHAQIYGD